MDFADTKTLLAERDGEWDASNVPQIYFNRVEKAIQGLTCTGITLDLNKRSNIEQKWEPRSTVRVYLRHSLFHARSVALVYFPSTGHVSPQYHAVFDNDFTMVPYMEAGTIPPHWSDLLK